MTLHSRKHISRCLNILRRLLNGLQHPALDHVYLPPPPFQGETQEGPLKVSLPSRSPIRLPHPSALPQLSYLFRVSGSCFSTPSRSLYGLSVYSSDPLIPGTFFQGFGGSLGVSSGGRGAIRPNLKWYVTNAEASRVAEMLLPEAGRHKKLLEIVRGLERTRSKETMQALVEETKLLRKCFNESCSISSWSCFVELVDSNGHLMFDLTIGRVRFRVQHKEERLLASISSFLAQEGFPEASLPKVTSALFGKASGGVRRFLWEARGERLAQFVLLKLLEHGLVVKRRKALVALEFLESQRGGIPEKVEESSLSFILSESNHCMKSRSSQPRQRISRLIAALHKDLRSRNLLSLPTEGVESSLEVFRHLRRGYGDETHRRILRGWIRNLCRGGASLNQKLK